MMAYLVVETKKGDIRRLPFGDSSTAQQGFDLGLILNDEHNQLVNLATSYFIEITEEE
ncbi:hypothetical protein [Bacillus toyonensis]|uniref:hypothetical protein n=1 Tax=Bacillus toyonensis TaxID=155322 RepID=UPI00159BE4D5|nr:hypothetical protein [Bacillus toyonensis]